ncbi:hypothetical protein [Streptosporangium vulgare]|uniref:hypothetical protein n=1 Tax=Streptosporangium vulgare TaxID=46190 RepID=UPI0031E111D7
MGWTAAFAVVAVLFVLTSGANDGATLIGLGLRFPRSPGWAIAGLLVVVLFAGPYVLGVAVARTFTERLAGLGTSGGAAAFLAGVVTAVIVVAVLTGRGLPTSLTLAVIGGISGAGFGAGLPVSWRNLGAVLAVGAAAPPGRPGPGPPAGNPVAPGAVPPPDVPARALRPPAGLHGPVRGLRGERRPEDDRGGQRRAERGP